MVLLWYSISLIFEIIFILGDKVAFWDGATKIGSAENSQHRVRKDARKGKVHLLGYDFGHWLISNRYLIKRINT